MSYFQLTFKLLLGQIIYYYRSVFNAGQPARSRLSPLTNWVHLETTRVPSGRSPSVLPRDLTAWHPAHFRYRMRVMRSASVGPHSVRQCPRLRADDGTRLNQNISFATCIEHSWPINSLRPLQSHHKPRCCVECFPYRVPYRSRATYVHLRVTRRQCSARKSQTIIQLNYERIIAERDF
jgi:hypothetical protein